MSDVLSLSLFAKQVSAICEEMGAVLRRTAFSPNIRDRMDYSCAVFDAEGTLVEQAAAIPVHLGSMAYAMAGVIAEIDWRPDRQAIFNDPFRGGTHLPDVTVVAPVYVAGRRVAFVANRAHHADIGSDTPGSMPISDRLDQEGIVIAPTSIDDEADLVRILPMVAESAASRGDFAAQLSANVTGVQRLTKRIAVLGHAGWDTSVAALYDYARKLALASIESIPDGVYLFEDYMDDDGQGTRHVPIRLAVTVAGGEATFDFTGSSPQVAGNINCPLAVTAAAVHYVVRCLMPSHAPQSGGAMSAISLVVPPGSMLNARYPAAVAAGNVETSMRVVDVVCGALAQALPDFVPAASQGTMNNVALGRRDGETKWSFYETLAGGCGAAREHAGRSATHSHMTNTLNTPIESMEYLFPIRIRRYQIRHGSGGAGHYRGGDGLLREYEFLAATEVSLITERRVSRPWGIAGGQAGQAGANSLNATPLPPKCSLSVSPGDVLCIATPAGGGWGDAGSAARK